MLANWIWGNPVGGRSHSCSSPVRAPVRVPLRNRTSYPAGVGHTHRWRPALLLTSFAQHSRRSVSQTTLVSTVRCGQLLEPRGTESLLTRAWYPPVPVGARYLRAPCAAFSGLSCSLQDGEAIGFKRKVSLERCFISGETGESTWEFLPSAFWRLRATVRPTMDRRLSHQASLTGCGSGRAAWPDRHGLCSCCHF